MKNKQQYRILKYEYFNQYSVATTEYYYIQKFSPNWIGWWRWRDITHTECPWSDCHEVRTKFKTQEDAEIFVNTKLCVKLPKAKERDTILKTFECGK